MDKKKKKAKGSDVYEDPLKPSAFEIEVANYLHNNLPTVDGKLSGCRVSIFYAADAVELLIKSQWSKFKLRNKSTEHVQFSSEESAVRFMTKLLEKNMISRAIKAKKKVVNKRKELEKRKLKTSKGTDSKVSKSEKSQNEVGEHDSETEKVESKSLTESSAEKPESKSKKPSGASFGFPFFSTPAPKPIRLEYTETQVFTLDDPETVYVWIHEPPPSLKTWLLGAALIIGIIFCCFFPIWPWQLRQGAYYLTVLVLLLLCLLFVTALIRLSLYACVFLLSLGQRHFWLFPNFFADCGFFESFRPFYSFEKTAAAAAAASPTKLTKREGKRSSKKAAIPSVESSFPASVDQQLAEGDSEKVSIGKQD
uniref:Translocation protein SEC62 n=1 Tax=Schistocephalus solidus TaxID=70667 RepID=A0A0X3PJ58_SCHSO